MEKGGVRFSIRGQTYTFVLNTSAMVSVEKHFSTPEKDVTWDEIWTRVMRGSVKTMVGLLWAMLQTHHSTLTIPDVERLIDDAGGFEQFLHIMRQAAKQATPDPADVKELKIPSRPRTAQGGRRGTGGVSTSTRGASV